MDHIRSNAILSLTGACPGCAPLLWCGGSTCECDKDEASEPKVGGREGLALPQPSEGPALVPQGNLQGNGRSGSPRLVAYDMSQPYSTGDGVDKGAAALQPPGQF